MNTLNLIQLNLRSPYEVWNESENDYFFVTDYGVVYKETGDNKQAMRNRLFIRWFNEYSFQQNYILRTAMVKDGEQENFAAIIVQRSHPDLDNILMTFDETIEYFKEKP